MAFLTGPYLEAVDALSRATLASESDREGMLIDATLQVPEAFELLDARDTRERIEVTLRLKPQATPIDTMEAIGAYIESLRYEHALVSRDAERNYLLATASASGLGQLILIRVLAAGTDHEEAAPSLRLV